jgi:hypothetical protein
MSHIVASTVVILGVKNFMLARIKKGMNFTSSLRMKGGNTDGRIL